MNNKITQLIELILTFKIRENDMNLTREHLDLVVIKLGIVYDRKIVPELAEMYWNCLKDELSNEELTEAMERHISNTNREIHSSFPMQGSLLKASKAWHERDQKRTHEERMLELLD